MLNDDTVSAATLSEWQRRAQRHLVSYIEKGAAFGLPPLKWTLATNGALTGEADSLTYTPDGQREAIRLYAQHIGASVETRATADGEELYVGWESNRYGTRGCFRATIVVPREVPQPENQ